MKVISLLDPSICSSNLGDQIIIDSVDNIIDTTFNEPLLIRIQTQDKISSNSYKYMRMSDFKIIGGTNLLSSKMNSYKQWKVNLWDSLFINDIILLGVGWWKYQKKPNFYTRVLYKVLLSNSYIHSVRDSYTEQKLKSIGIPNVVNTSCPTLWTLTEEHCSNIPRKKSDSVLVTFTEYHQNEKLDFNLVKVLSQNYQKIYFWTQQPKDYHYMQSFCGKGAIYLKPSLKALDQCLSSCDVDYIGTRLHAGIRALQHSRRALILAIDNRATEIAKDTNLPVIKREDIDSIKHWIDSSYETKINLPIENINIWKKQF